jgi:hypothetical protein
MILMAVFAVWAALFTWMVFSCWRAPLGYEDRSGFHYGSIPGHDDASPPTQRHRSRGRPRRTNEPGRRLAI